MQCPQCGTEAGPSEFCPSCLAKVGTPALQGAALEQELARKELEEKKTRRDALDRQRRQSLIWIGAIGLAVILGMAISAVVDSLTSPRPAAPVTIDREPRVRCRAEGDCGTDSCGRPMACVSHVCVRREPAGPCPETKPER